jgi:hypothetical protein
MSLCCHCHHHCCFVLFIHLFVFETGSLYVVLAGLEIFYVNQIGPELTGVHLPQTPKCWDQWRAPQCPTWWWRFRNNTLPTLKALDLWVLLTRNIASCPLLSVISAWPTCHTDSCSITNSIRTITNPISTIGIPSYHYYLLTVRSCQPWLRLSSLHPYKPGAFSFIGSVLDTMESRLSGVTLECHWAASEAPGT